MRLRESVGSASDQRGASEGALREAERAERQLKAELELATSQAAELKVRRLRCSGREGTGEGMLLSWGRKSGNKRANWIVQP